MTLVTVTYDGQEKIKKKNVQYSDILLRKELLSGLTNKSGNIEDQGIFDPSIFYL